MTLCQELIWWFVPVHAHSITKKKLYETQQSRWICTTLLVRCCDLICNFHRQARDWIAEWKLEGPDGFIWKAFHGQSYGLCVGIPSWIFRNYTSEALHFYWLDKVCKGWIKWYGAGSYWQFSNVSYITTNITEKFQLLTCNGNCNSYIFNHLRILSAFLIK